MLEKFRTILEVIMRTLIRQNSIEHSQRKNDFDDQIAFLLLDVGVETTLKTFLSLRGKLEDNKDVGFKDLINAVRKELDGTDQNIDFDSAYYFHKIRNKLYHRGDGTKPTNENLQGYSELAKEILKKLLDVDVTKFEPDSESVNMVWGRWEHWEGERTTEDINSELSERLRYFHESCAILSEQLRPKYATRKFALELQKIWDQIQVQRDSLNAWEDVIDGSEVEIAEAKRDAAEERLRLADARLRLLGEAMGKDIEESVENYELVDLVLENVNHLFVLVALQELSEHVEGDWDKYLRVFRTISGSKIARLYAQAVNQEYKAILSWIKDYQEKVDKRLEELIPNIYRPGPNIPVRI